MCLRVCATARKWQNNNKRVCVSEFACICHRDIDISKQTMDACCLWNRIRRLCWFCAHLKTTRARSSNWRSNQQIIYFGSFWFWLLTEKRLIHNSSSSKKLDTGPELCATFWHHRFVFFFFIIRECEWESFLTESLDSGQWRGPFSGFGWEQSVL